MVEQVRYQATGSDFMDAFRSTRAAKNVFLVILLLSILVQIAAFVAVFFLDVVDPIHRAPAQATATAAVANQDQAKPAAKTATQPTTTQKTDRGEERFQEMAVFVDEVLNWALPGARFFALVSCLLLCLTLLTSMKICMLERLSGIGMMASAFYWSLVLLAMVTPWQQILHGEVACGALYNKGEMYSWIARVKPSWGGTVPDVWGQVLFYARFLGYPVLALLIWLVVQLKFARGYRMLTPTTTPNARPKRRKAGNEEVETPDLPLEDLQ
ncbi:MAG: hypothetical protein ACLFV7_00895 [Phycisphaerae bacterium]